ncbi:MAG: hypothetical protein DI626_07915 [Micavibrio aeruginosavorus]|uniref:DUF465 domain-containing protein n=1 Tax=Micavibrio aeruginosavorus TaxID=349221 RepID=A0A2W5BNN1_9BACT|nr:MAG: hypothetical protein DI626_07915 [Micavibrio aeruginosavorus]
MSYRLFQSLLFRASKIQERIEDELKRKSPSRLRLLKMKKIRLLIANRLQGMLHHDSAMQLRPVPVRANKKFYR